MTILVRARHRGATGAANRARMEERNAALARGRARAVRVPAKWHGGSRRLPSGFAGGAELVAVGTTRDRRCRGGRCVSGNRGLGHPRERLRRLRSGIGIAGLPSGVEAEPALPVAIRANGTIYLTLHAAPEASPGNYAVTLRATSGAIESVRTLALSVAAPGGLPIRSSLVPTGAAPYRIAYDARTGLAFASMTYWNEVAVIAVTEGRLVARIPVPGCTSLHFSPDMSELVVGSTTEYVSVIDPLRLEVVERTAFPAEVNGGGGPANIPLDVVPLANGTWLVVANQQHSTGLSLVQWDRATGRLVNRTPGSGEITDATPSPDGTGTYSSRIARPSRS